MEPRKYKNKHHQNWKLRLKRENLEKRRETREEGHEGGEEKGSRDVQTNEWNVLDLEIFENGDEDELMEKWRKLVLCIICIPIFPSLSSS